MPELIPVRQYMGALPESIEEELTLSDAKDRMFALGVHHLPVLRDGKLVGILSHRDIAIAEALAAVSSASIPVSQVMTAMPFTCGPNAHVEAVAREMADHYYGSAVVVEPEHPTQVLGVFTTTDALRALADLVDRLRTA
jgi:acetoin utilization protein AcuB